MGAIRKYDSLTVSEKIAFLKIEELDNDILMMNLNDISNYCQVSTATINRALKKMGYKNLKHFKATLNIKTATSSKSNLSISPFEEAICQTVESFDSKLIDTTTSQIISANCVYIIGFGITTSLALDFYINLRKLGKHVFYINDSDMLQIINDTTLTTNGLIIYISYSGNDEDMNKCALSHKSTFNQILVTSNVDCQLAKNCNLILSSNTYSISNSFNSRIPLAIILFKIMQQYAIKTYNSQ